MSKPEETIHSWMSLTADQQKVIVDIHLKALKLKDYDTLFRVFNLANPNIVAGPDWEYCRIHKDSVKTVTLLTKQYC